MTTLPKYASDLPLKEVESAEQLDITRAPRAIQEALKIGREFPEGMQRHRFESRERGSVMVQFVSIRDIRDCYFLALWQSMGIPQEDWPDDVHDIPLEDLDPVAIAHNLQCNLEAHMGIYPNNREGDQPDASIVGVDELNEPMGSDADREGLPDAAQG